MVDLVVRVPSSMGPSRLEGLGRVWSCGGKGAGAVGAIPGPQYPSLPSGLGGKNSRLETIPALSTKGYTGRNRRRFPDNLGAR